MDTADSQKASSGINKVVPRGPSDLTNYVPEKGLKNIAVAEEAENYNVFNPAL